MRTLVLLRHGESQWNRENRFTGWVDVPLSDKGVDEARAAGALLRDGGYRFDVAHTSLLKRAIKTLWLALEELDQMWLPVHKTWRLNERMYGALQGLNKTEMVKLHGAEQVHLWRRSYDVPPPALDASSPEWPGRDPRYAGVAPGDIPGSECLKDTVRRMMPLWESTLVPALREGQRVLITAHGNSLRALVKHLDGVSDDDIVGLNIPTGIPLVYELDDVTLKPLRPSRYLGDPEAAARAAAAVAAQTRV